MRQDQLLFLNREQSRCWGEGERTLVLDWTCSLMQAEDGKKLEKGACTQQAMWCCFIWSPEVRQGGKPSLGKTLIQGEPQRGTEALGGSWLCEGPQGASVGPGPEPSGPGVTRGAGGWGGGTGSPVASSRPSWVTWSLWLTHSPLHLK